MARIQRLPWPTMNTPAHPAYTTYLAQRGRGDLAGAAETLKGVLKADPRADWAYNELVQLLWQSGRRADADTVVRAALRVNPLNAQAHNLFGTLLSELNDLSSGEWHFRRAIEVGGEQASFLANLGLNLMHQGRTEDAEACFARADALAPGSVHTLGHWSKLAEVCGDMQRAEELLDRAARASSEGDVSLLRANHLARSGKPAEALAMLADEPTLNGDARLLRGRLLDRLGRYDEAWRDFVTGKELLAREGGGVVYDAKGVETFFARMERFFVRANIERLPRAPVRTGAPQPIFIMGAPRSGTTLIEQVLCSHTAVRAGGELPFMMELRQFALLNFPGPEPFPENLWRTWTADKRYAATLFRDYYLARAEQYGLLAPRTAFFTDKMPFNEMWLPLLRMAFPEAPVVRVVRHPLDVCVSMLSNNLTHGFNCAYRIADIVRHVAAMHEIVDCYEQQMDVGVLVLRYESFVADQLAQTQRLLDYVGVPLEPACLRFHESRRYAPTPSYAQVTEKLNDRSIGRYRHYLAHLQPFAAQLQRIMSAHDYAT
jgi:Tfp pilus assembly protein PilF